MIYWYNWLFLVCFWIFVINFKVVNDIFFYVFVDEFCYDKWGEFEIYEIGIREFE